MIATLGDMVRVGRHSGIEVGFLSILSAATARGLRAAQPIEVVKAIVEQPDGSRGTYEQQ